MRPQIGGHRRERLEQIGKQALIRLNQNVAAVEDVKVHFARVPVDRGFHRISDVVQLLAFRYRFRPSTDAPPKSYIRLPSRQGARYW